MILFPLSERLIPTCIPTPEMSSTGSGVFASLVSLDRTFVVQVLSKSDNNFTVRFCAWSRNGRYPNPDDHAWQWFRTESVILTDSVETALSIGKAEAETKGIIFQEETQQIGAPYVFAARVR